MTEVETKTQSEELKIRTQEFFDVKQTAEFSPIMNAAIDL